jgi:hypothetical protein
VRAEGVEEVGDVSGWGSPKAFVPWPKFGRLNPVNHLPFELLSWLALKSSFAITRVERSLYERANGYSYDAVKIGWLLRAPLGQQTRTGELLIEIATKRFLPSASASVGLQKGYPAQFGCQWVIVCVQGHQLARRA